MSMRPVESLLSGLLLLSFNDFFQCARFVGFRDLSFVSRWGQSFVFLKNVVNVALDLIGNILNGNNEKDWW